MEPSGTAGSPQPPIISMMHEASRAKEPAASGDSYAATLIRRNMPVTE